MLGLERLDRIGAASALLGGALLASAPAHRLDLLLLGGAATLLGLFREPRLGPALVGAALPLYFFSRDLGPLPVSPPGALLVCAWLATLARAAADRLRQGGDEFGRLSTSFGVGIALFLVAGLLSLLPSEYLKLSARELRSLILEPVLFFWLLVVLRRQRAAQLSLLGFVATAVVLASVGIWQVALGAGGTAAEGVRRAQAWYPSPNHFALTLGRALPFALAAALGGGAWRTRLGAGAASLLFAVALLLSFSLGAWLGALAASVAVLWLLGRRRWATLLLSVGLLGSAVVSALAVAAVLPERLNPVRSTSVFRLDLWISSMQMARDHPLLGIGLDNFVYLYQTIYLREGAAAEPNLSHPHNWVLHFWLQLGALGLIAFLWLVVRGWRTALAGLRAGVPGRDWLLAGALASLVAMLVHGSIDNSYFLVDLAFLFWMTLALIEEVALEPGGTSKPTGKLPDE